MTELQAPKLLALEARESAYKQQIAELQAENERLRANAPTIDSTPSCGQENDYRRASEGEWIKAQQEAALTAIARRYLADHVPTSQSVMMPMKAFRPADLPQSSRVTEKMVQAAINAAWPGPEVVYDDNFDCVEDMMRAALEAALTVTRPLHNSQGE